MTNISVNPAHRRLRSALTRLLSDYAHEKGLRTVSTARTKRHAGKPSAPEPEIEWLERGRAIWKFYVLPDRRKLSRLCPDLKLAASIVLCSDSSDNLGVIDPARLLEFMEKNVPSPDRGTIRSLKKDVPSVPIMFPDFHFKGLVKKNHHFRKDHFSLRIRTRQTPKPAPGQFLQLLCDPAPHAQDPKYRCHSYARGRRPRLRDMEMLSRRPFLRRPFSIASYGPPSPRDTATDTRLFGAEWLQLVNWVEPEFEVIYRRVPGGPGTGALARCRAGDELDVVGPLGKGFNIAPLPDVALLVGGGIGATPLLFLAEDLVRSGVETKVFFGALTKSRIPFQLRGKPRTRIARFERLGLRPVICTDDGTAGYRGLVTDPLTRYLEKKAEAGPALKIFACGPRPMLAALEGIATRYGVPCEVLLEERMACGFGACTSCVCGVKETGRRTHYTRICTTGPAFDARTVMWHA